MSAPAAAEGRSPLRYSAFRWLLAARTTSIVGNAIAPIALAFAVLDLTGSAGDLGLVLAARSLANVAVLLLGGVIADRLPRSVVLVGTSLAAGATQAVVAALVLSDTATIPLLAALSALNGAVAAVSLPAAAALVPETVPASQLRPANALLRLSLNAGTVLGASAGAAVVALTGPGWGLAVDAGGFTVAALLFARLRLPRAAGSGGPRSSVLADLRDGWRAFTSRTWLWVVVAQFCVLNAAFIGAVAVLGPVVAKASFGAAGWGAVVAAETVGFALGALVALRWRPRHALGTGVALMAVTALPVVALAVVPQVLPLVVAFAVGGAATELFAVAWDQSLQRHVPGELLSRVYSYDALGSFVAVPFGEALAGPLAQGVGTTPVLLGAGGLIVAATAVALCAPSVRRLTDDPAGSQNSRGAPDSTPFMPS